MSLPKRLTLSDGSVYELVEDERATYGYRFYLEQPTKKKPGGVEWRECPPPRYSEILEALLETGND